MSTLTDIDRRLAKLKRQINLRTMTSSFVITVVGLQMILVARIEAPSDADLFLRFGLIFVLVAYSVFELRTMAALTAERALLLHDRSKASA